MMRWTPAVVAAVLAAASAPALADGNYSVRNGTSRAFTCGLLRERRSIIDRFVLRSGTEWRQTSSDEGRRVLYCDSAKITQRWPMHSGVPYVLREDRRTGHIVLRSIAAAR